MPRQFFKTIYELTKNDLTEASNANLPLAQLLQNDLYLKALIEDLESSSLFVNLLEINSESENTGRIDSDTKTYNDWTKTNCTFTTTNIATSGAPNLVGTITPALSGTDNSLTLQFANPIVIPERIKKSRIVVAIEAEVDTAIQGSSYPTIEFTTSTSSPDKLELTTSMKTYVFTEIIEADRDQSVLKINWSNIPLTDFNTKILISKIYVGVFTHDVSELEDDDIINDSFDIESLYDFAYNLFRVNADTVDGLHAKELIDKAVDTAVVTGGTTINYNTYQGAGPQVDNIQGFLSSDSKDGVAAAVNLGAEIFFEHPSNCELIKGTIQLWWEKTGITSNYEEPNGNADFTYNLNTGVITYSSRIIVDNFSTNTTGSNSLSLTAAYQTLEQTTDGKYFLKVRYDSVAGRLYFQSIRDASSDEYCHIGGKVDYMRLVSLGGASYGCREYAGEVEWLTAATVRIIPGQRLSSDDSTIMEWGVNLNIDITSSGVGGLDAGVEANNTWYYVYVIYNPTTNTYNGLLSTSSTTPTLPAGYTKYRRVGSIRNDGSSDIIRFTQKNDMFYFYDEQTIINGTVVARNTWHTISYAAAVPPTSIEYYGSIYAGRTTYPIRGYATYIHMRDTDIRSEIRPWMFRNEDWDNQLFRWAGSTYELPNGSSQTLDYYIYILATGASYNPQVYLRISKYRDDLR